MTRPRVRNGPIPHGTRRGYQRCVQRPEGACDACKDANADYATASGAQRRGLQPPATPVTVLATAKPQQRVQAVPGYGDQPGPVEEKVIAELATLSAAQRMLSTAAAAIKASQDLDDDRKWSAHAALMRQLDAAMGQLRRASATERKGNLAAVASLAQRRAADAG